MKIRHEIINKTSAKEFSFEPYRIKITREAIEAFLNGKPIVCHHINGVGIPRKQLINNDMYLNRPANELMILSSAEHSRLHMKGKKLKPFSEEHKMKIGEAKKGERNPNFGKPSWNKGKAMSEEQKQKLSASHKGKPTWNKGKKMKPPSNKGKHLVIIDGKRKYI